MDMTSLVVQMATTSNHPLSPVLNVQVIKVIGEMMNANVPLLKELMEIIVMTVL